MVFPWTLHCSCRNLHTQEFLKHCPCKNLHMWKLTHTRGNVFSHRHLHKKTSNFFLVKMVDLWRQQLLQQLQDNMDDDEGEELFFVRTIHMFASNIVEVFWWHGGSAPWQSKKLPKDWQQGHEWIYHDYFAPSPMFREVLFRHKCRMTQNLFLCIMACVCEYDVLFVQCPDCIKKFGLFSIQKCIITL